MINIFVKIIFLLSTMYILFYCSSYAKFEIMKKKNRLGGVIIFLFTIASVIFSNIMLYRTNRNFIIFNAYIKIDSFLAIYNFCI